MKRLAFRLIDLYLSPFQLHPSLGLFARDRILSHSEHLFATGHFIRRNGFATDEPVVDVGAYDGGTCLFFANYFSQNNVIGFEPNSSAYEQAVEKCRSNSRISLFPVALDREGGEKVFYVSDNRLSSSLNPIRDNVQFHLSEQMKVRTTTLDEFFKDERGITLLKLDTQGRELNILKGGTETLKKTRYILTEMNNHRLYEGGCQYYEVDEFLRNNNFLLAHLSSNYVSTGITEFDALYRNSRF